MIEMAAEANFKMDQLLIENEYLKNKMDKDFQS